MNIRGRRKSGISPTLRIAFFGPDGAGKSSVIARFRDQLGPASAGLTQYHFRPMFFSRGRDRPPVLDPHSQTPRGGVTSVFKLLYWLMDYWYGHLLTNCFAGTGSSLVIFDRYFHDVLVDPLRYRLPLSSLWLARLLVPLAPRPDLCILLDVPAEVLQDRKCEVSPGESHRQRIAYLEMFRLMPDKLLVDANRPLDEVARQVNTAVFSYFVPSLTLQPEASHLATY